MATTTQPYLRASLLVNGAEALLTIDEALALGRGNRMIDMRTLVVLFTCGSPYMLVALFILSPVLLDPPQRQEWAVSELAQSLQSSVFFALCGAGGVVMSSLADRFGRKRLLQLTSTGAILLGLGCAAATSSTMFTVLRAALGFNVGGVVTCSYLLAMEWTPLHACSTTATALNVGWTLSTVAMVGLSKLCDNWGGGWRVQQVVFVAPLAPVLALLTLRSVGESPRYLLAARKTEPARAVLIASARFNGVVLDESAAWRLQETMETDAPAPAGPAACRHQLAAAPFRGYAAVCAFGWLTTQLIYFGLDFSLGHCAPPHCDLPLHTALLAAADLPGYMLCGLMSATVGRRITQAVSFAVAGVSMMLAYLLTRCAADASLTLAPSLVAKVAVAITFQLAFQYPTEIFPASVRGCALGFIEMVGRVGGTVAPPVARALPLWTQQVVFAACAMIASVLTLCVLPETRIPPKRAKLVAGELAGVAPPPVDDDPRPYAPFVQDSQDSQDRRLAATVQPAARVPQRPR